MSAHISQIDILSVLILQIDKVVNQLEKTPFLLHMVSCTLYMIAENTQIYIISRRHLSSFLSLTMTNFKIFVDV